MSISRRHFLIRLIPLVFSLILFTCQERVFKNPHDETSTLDPKSWAPSNLQAQMLADSTIKLTWQHEGGNIDGFKIDKQVGSLTWIHEYALLAKTDREWIDANKVFDTTLTYRLYAYANSNYSAYDSITSFIHSIHGCTDLDAANYNPEAQVDDGSCIYPLIVISPKGEEEWLIGSEQTITWERNDLSRMIGGDFDLPQNKLITKKKRADKKSKTVINRQKNPQVPIMKGNKKPTMARSNIKGKIQELNGTMPLTVNNKNGKVKIELYADGTVYAIIKNSTDDDGSYSWMITPDTYSGGSTFKIRITDIVDTSVYAESENYFTLIEIPGCTDSHASNYDITATIDDDSCTYDTPTEGLVAWYPFNGNAEDASGNGNDGDINEGTDSEATLTTDRFGNDNSAYSFDGVDDFVALTSPFNTVDDLDGTLCVWFNTLQQSAGWIIGQDFSGSNRDWWFTSNRNNAGRLVFMIDDTADNNREVESDPGNDLSDGQWHQVCGLWGDTGMSMYIDGTLQSNTNAYDIYPNTAVASYIGCYRGGTYPSGTSCNGNFDGKVDDIHIYSRALNKIEISKLYCDGGWCIAGCTDPNANNYDENATTDDGSCEYEITEDLVAYYPFNGNADDESGNGNDGDINEGTDSEATLTTDRFGNDNSAYSFDGVDDFVALTSPFNTVDDLDGTLCVWFNTLQQSAGWIIGQDFSGSNRDWWFTSNRNNAGRLVFMIDDTADNNREVESDPGNDLSDGQWHQVCGLWGDTGMSMYIDGTLQSNTNAYDIYPNTAVASYIGCYRGGTYPSGTSCNGNFDGKVDDIHIYSRALNKIEISKLYCDGGWCIAGCTDPNANNYDENATTDDGSCEYEITEDLVAYYPFNGNADDESGNGNDGDINEGTYSEPILTTDRFGNESSAYSFDGVDDYIDLGNGSQFNFGTGVFSLSAWFQTLTIQDGRILSKTNHEADDGFQLGLSAAIPKFYLLDSNPVASSDVTLNDNIWHNLVGIRSGDQLQLYVDGVLEHTVIGVVGYDVSSNNTLKIGKRDGTQDLPFQGNIDDIHIYNHALNETEITELYCDGGWCEHQSLVAYYPFNGNANDESGNGNDGDINEETDSEPTLTTDRFGNENSAYSFDGINDFIVIDPEFSYSNEISMGGWLKIDALSKGITIVSKRFGNFGGEDFQLYYEGPGDYKMVGILWGLSTERCRGTINSVIDNDWHHYFFTYDGSFMVMYIDGVINQTCTSSGTVNNNNLNMRIGEDWYGNYGDGDIDEVRIYNRALSASEVQALYQQ